MTDIKDANVKLICSKLQNAGYEAFVVGGAVRDNIMGKNPHDYDITSNASPADIKRLFSGYFQILEIGEAFGITAVVVNGTPYEIAQYRKDIGGNGRKPDSVEMVRDIEIDLARRDFTMNAIAMDPISGIIRDPFAGSVDILDKIIDFVGDPAARIVEDKLRILRAFRFMSQLSFTISDESLTAIKAFINLGGDFSSVSQERITAELSKLFVGPNAFETIKLMFEIGLMQILIPETVRLLEDHNSGWHREEMAPFGNSILAHVLNVVKFMETEMQKVEEDRLILMLAALLHDIGKPLVREGKPDGFDRFHTHDIVGANLTSEILVRMKFSNDIVNRVTNLVKMHMNIHNLLVMKDIAKIRKLLGKSDFHLMKILGFCDTIGSSKNGKIPNFEEAENFVKKVDELIEQFGCELPLPIINGNNLIEAGFKPGPEFKRALDIAFNEQLRGISKKQKLLNQSISFLKNIS